MAFRELRNYYDSVYGAPAETPVLGLVAGAGFLFLLAASLYFVTKTGRRSARQAGSVSARIGALSFLTVVCFMFGTVGGLGTLISFFTSDLRGWNRIAIFIAALALAGLGLLVDAALRRLPRPTAGLFAGLLRLMPALAGSLILILGAWDQTSPLLVPDYSSVGAAYRADQQMVDEIEAATSPTAMILQLPFHPFPEYMSPQGVLDANQLKPYLHSHTLRWSGAGIKGRPASDWLAAVERLPADAVITTAVASGFDGLFIDTHDLNTSGSTLAAGIAEQLGRPTVMSTDGRYVFYTLASASAALRAGSRGPELERIGQIAVSPVIPQFLPRLDSYSGPQMLQPYRPRIELDNDRAETVEVRLRFTLAYTAGEATLSAALPDGTTQTLAATPSGTMHELIVQVPPGVSTLAFAVIAGPPALHVAAQQGPILASRVEADDVELLRLLGRADDKG